MGRKGVALALAAAAAGAVLWQGLWPGLLPGLSQGPGGAVPASAVAVAADTTVPTARPVAASAPLPAAARAVPPLQFEPNRGQAPKAVRYVSRGPRHRISIFDDGLALTVPAGARAASLRFVGAAAGPGLEPRAPAPGVTHHLRGSDPRAWQRGLPRYQQLRRAGLYPGIDLVYYSRDGELEFDLVVHPGADPSQIRLQVQGSQPALIDDQGRLRLDGRDGQLAVQRPVLFQQVDGERIRLDAQWQRHGDGSFGFALPAYDRSRVLVIDPVFRLQYATYLGGVHDDAPQAIARDAQGNVYVVGQSASEDWPVSGNALQRTRQNLGRYAYDVVVSKFDAAGTLLWSTFYGGLQDERGRAIQVDAAGRVVIAGETASDDLPTTAGALQRTRRGATDGFIAVLSPDGSVLEQATYYGASGGASIHALASDAQGRLVTAGSAGPGLSTTTGAYKATQAIGKAAFVARFTGIGVGPLQLQAASYYGTDNPEANSQTLGNLGYALALDADGAPWIAGQAFTTRLPLTADALHGAPPAMDAACTAGVQPLNSFAYVARLSADLGALRYASYLSGNTRAPGLQACSEYALALHVDAAGDLYVGGATASDRFPTTAGALQAAYPGNGSGYAGHVTKLRRDGQATLWSTYLGGRNGNTFVATLAPGAGGSLWVGSSTEGGSNLPLSTDALQGSFGGGYDGAYHRLDADTGALRFGSLIGGGAVDGVAALSDDGAGNLTLAGNTQSLNFPVTARAFQPAYGNGDAADWFLAVVGDSSIARISPARGGNLGDVTLRLSGFGFQSQDRCALSGAGQTMAALQTVVSADGLGITCTFALAGAALGRYDVVVSHTDGSRLVRSGGFEVTAGTGPDLSVDVIGRSAVRIGTPADFNVVVSNQGDADALGVVLFVRFSAGLKPVDATKPDPFDLNPIPTAVLFPNDATDYASRSVIVPSNLKPGENMVPLMLPLLAAGTSTTLNFRLVASEETAEEYVEAEITGTLAATQAERANPAALRGITRLLRTAAAGSDRSRVQGLDSEACRKALWDYAWDKAAGKVPGVDCFRDFQRAVFEAQRYQLTHPANRVSLMGDIATATFKSATDCAELAGIELAVPIEAAKRFLDLLNDADAAAKIADACKDKDKGKDKKKSKTPTKPKKSTDPNDKSGPTGDDSPARYVAQARPMTYQIAFENVASAGLPAAEVVVTDVLDAAKFDLATLSLGEVSWGTQRLEIPSGRSAHAATMAIGGGLAVRVAASLNSSTGVLKWTFTTLDAATHLPPSDPTLGFLPPNRNGIEGQGYVNFTISPKAGLRDGTRWENAASIVFDANAAIVTPTWVNTLDSTAPVSRVSVATQLAGSAELQVNWGGTDAGSGVGTYTVWLSEDGGPFAVWKAATTETSAVLLSSKVGSRYGFFVVASDRAGNVEAAKSVAEVSVLVVDPAAASGGGGGGGCTLARTGRHDAALPLLLLAALALALRRRMRSVGGPPIQGGMAAGGHA